MGFWDTLLAKLAGLPKEYPEIFQIAIQASGEVLELHRELHESAALAGIVAHRISRRNGC